MIRIIKGNIISTSVFGQMDIIKNGYLVYSEERINGVFSTLPEKYKNLAIDDYHDALVMQAFSDMHLHAPQYPMLGMGMDLPLLDWLNRYTYKTESRFSDLDYARSVYHELAQKLIQYGTTRVCMFSSLHTDATLILMEELEKAGICGYVGKVSMDINSPDYYCETTEKSKSETIRWLDSCARFKNINPMITPRFTISCSRELMIWLGTIADERSLPIQSHLSENNKEIKRVLENHPDCQQYWQTYAKSKLWNSRTLMAHCVYSDSYEREAMRKAGVYTVHCADSNMNIASGIAPVRTLLNEGNKVVLGSDIAGGASLSMLDAIQMTIRASKVYSIASNWEVPYLTVAEAYYLGTSAANEFFGEKPGFSEGNTLHAVVIDDTKFLNTKELSLNERFERSVYLAKPDDIIAVYSNGKRVK